MAAWHLPNKVDVTSAQNSPNLTTFYVPTSLLFASPTTPTSQPRLPRLQNKQRAFIHGASPASGRRRASDAGYG